jgi:integrase
VGIRPLPRERVLSSVDLEAFLATSRGAAHSAFPVLLFLADTGCRIGEAVALRWDDVNLGTGQARIERSIDHLGRLGPTKTRRARVVKLSTRLRDVLAVLRPDVHGEAALVFPNAEGKPLDSRNFAQREFARVARLTFGRARRVTPHDLRHTWVSRHLAAGTPLKWIQERGGWTTAKVLLDVYGSTSCRPSCAASPTLLRRLRRTKRTPGALSAARGRDARASGCC